MANKFDFGKIEKQARNTFEAMLVAVGNEAKNQFVSSFRTQGFEDKTVTKWAPRKKADKRAGRAILVKSGDLRRSIVVSSITKSNLSIKISSDLPYSKIHNDGLMGKAWGKYPFKMPKRQFMGDSFKMNEKVKAIIVRRLDNVFKK